MGKGISSCDSKGCRYLDLLEILIYESSTVIAPLCTIHQDGKFEHFEFLPL